MHQILLDSFLKKPWIYAKKEGQVGYTVSGFCAIAIGLEYNCLGILQQKIYVWNLNDLITSK